MSRSATRLRSLAPYMLLGPVTGLLTAGVVRNLQAGQPLLASLYAFATLETWIVLPLMAHNVVLAVALLKP